MRVITASIILFLLVQQRLVAQSRDQEDTLFDRFETPPASARPWVFWYWMHAAVSREGIHADLEAMKRAGIGGAYLMPLRDTSSSIPFQPTARQLSPEWWALVKYAMEEAARLDLQLGMHVSDGFALAGGPWITPEKSMQKLVWTTSRIRGNAKRQITLPHPEAVQGYYRDIAVYAYPVKAAGAGALLSLPKVTTSNGIEASYLADRGAKGSFKSDSSCWIQYAWEQPVTCRSITIHVGGNNYQAQRLWIQKSNDGVNFTPVTRLKCPRHGWQDTDEDYTYSLPATTARYFRFVYDKEGTEPGAEDLDAAKWKPSFKVNGIWLGTEPVIHHFETKNGSVWRVAEPTSAEQVPTPEAITPADIIDLTGKMKANGELDWMIPAGNWNIVRIGHTSNGHTNYTGGAGLGLECDKFSPSAVRLQFENWFAKAFEKTDPALAAKVLKLFHVDSWECGSQNWGEGFLEAFHKKRGYDLRPWLLVMTGVPVKDAAFSEKVLYDVRQTIADLVNDVFYATVSKLAHEKGCLFSAEAIAPTMVSDGLRHYSYADLPMGEFWLNSPTHDKPNDMLDAISGAHIYGKQIVQSESFTSVRMNWGEHPGILKPLGDRNFALGINRIVMHVFTQNPWLDRKPGMTLDGVGLYYQRDQTWFDQSKAWIEYLSRCSGLLQLGKPVTDLAVFTGEEVPRRAVLPDRLVNILPGLMGVKRIQEEKRRLENKGQPQREWPRGVTNSANMADAEDWVDPLQGYAYDSFNPDVLAQMKVNAGRVYTPGGAFYRALVFGHLEKMDPAHRLSATTIGHIFRLLKAGATVIADTGYVRLLQRAGWNDRNGKGKLLRAPFTEAGARTWGVAPDVKVDKGAGRIAWTHRQEGTADIYFVANTDSVSRTTKMIFRVRNGMPEVWDPVTKQKLAVQWKLLAKGTEVTFEFAAGQSLFCVFRGSETEARTIRTRHYSGVSFDKTYWELEFDPNFGGPAQAVTMDTLVSWSSLRDSSARFYSGTVRYKNSFTWNGDKARARISIDSLYDIATVFVNGMECGIAWTRPYQVDISRAVRKGKNEIIIAVTNTWHNRLIGDQYLSPGKRITYTTAPFRLKDDPLLPAGIKGVRLEMDNL